MGQLEMLTYKVIFIMAFPGNHFLPTPSFQEMQHKQLKMCGHLRRQIDWENGFRADFKLPCASSLLHLVNGINSRTLPEKTGSKRSISGEALALNVNDRYKNGVNGKKCKYIIIYCRPPFFFPSFSRHSQNVSLMMKSVKIWCFIFNDGQQISPS